MSEVPPTAPVWNGRPSGDQFAELLAQRADALGLRVSIEVTPWQLDGAYGVSVDWPKSQAGVLFEVADWLDGVRILDPNGEDDSVEQGLAYFAARSQGHSATQALRRIRE